MHEEIQDTAEIHDTALHLLVDAGQRYTQNRRAVTEALASASAPITIAELLTASDRLAQSSTYRNLVILEAAGVVHKIITSDEHARYELTEEVTGTHHHHLVCGKCGIVLDVTLSDEIETALHEALASAASAEGFVGVHHRVDLLGECAACDAVSDH